MGVLVPFSSMAAPAAVEGINAAYKDGKIVVTWTPVEDASFYRVYHSSRSILENGGVYDDFQETWGPIPEHVLEAESLTEKVFVSVLAVNSDGEESPVFREETFALQSESTINKEGISLTDFAYTPGFENYQESTPDEEQKEVFTITKPTTQSAELPSLPELPEYGSEEVEEVPVQEQADDGGKLHLLLAEAISPTEALLTFSTFPSVDPTRAPEAFKIIDADGRDLRILSIFIQEELVAVRTETQVRDELYQVKLSEPLVGSNGFPLDERNRKMVFRGHEEGIEKREVVPEPPPIEEQTPEETFAAVPKRNVCDPQSVLTPPRVTGLRLRSVAQDNGTHTVHAHWSIDTRNCEELLRYIVRQSNNRGHTFTKPQIIPSDISGLDIPGVFPGEYGLGISVMNAQGHVTQEIFENITLPGARPAAPQPQPQPPVVQRPVPPPQVPAYVPPPPPSPPRLPLPQTGAELAIGGLIALGSAYGLHRKRKK